MTTLIVTAPKAIADQQWMIIAPVAQVRPMFPKDTQADLVQAARLFDLAPQNPPVDWARRNRA